MKLLISLCSLFLVISCYTQPTGRTHPESRLVGGPCEICGAIEGYDYDQLKAVDTLPDFSQSTQPIKITGTIFQPDGKTPAEGVVLYIYHTDEKGVYQQRSGKNDAGQYTYHQGWVKTDKNGQYAFYTFLPGAYPNSKEPMHIHPLIKEPNGKLYYIDAFVFDHDPLLTSAIRKANENRGGSGVIRLRQEKDLLVGRKDIILGLNVPGYSQDTGSHLRSGREIGEDVLSFTPYHVWGADQGKRVCPVCKYGRYHGLLYFVGPEESWSDIRAWLTYLEQESRARARYLKVYLVYGSEEAEAQLANLGKELDLENVALTQVPSFDDQSSEIHLMKINPAANNTLILFRNSRIIDKFIGLSPTEAHFEQLTSRLNETADNIFYLPAIEIR